MSGAMGGIEAADRRVAGRRLWLPAAVLVLALLIAAAARLAPLARTEAGLSRQQFEQATGLRLVRIAVTGGGGLIDIRYRALDPDKAVAIHDPSTPPTIIAESSGTSIDRPWMDHVHSQEVHLAVTYYTLLANPGGAIKPGDTVTFKLGDALLRGITVE